MVSKQEHRFAELRVDNSVLERFSQEMSPYYQDQPDKTRTERYNSCRKKLSWHIRNSLSQRQKETLTLILQGKREREIAQILGITHQVVHIYKVRALKKLREKLKL